MQKLIANLEDAIRSTRLHGVNTREPQLLWAMQIDSKGPHRAARTRGHIAGRDVGIPSES